MQPIIAAIAAMSENRIIGKDNQLPWHLSADLKHFKALTTGHTIIMGRKTYQSIGKPLPNRRNVVLTRDQTFQAEGVEVVHSVEAACKLIKNDPKAFVIGGAEIYQAFTPYLNYLYLTVIHQEFDGDVYLPFDLTDWKEEQRIPHDETPTGGYRYDFAEFSKA